jgi:putative oxidoreductase
MKGTQQDVITSLGLLVLRLGAGGLLFGAHGWAKLMNIAERAPKFSDPIGLGPQASFGLVVFAEVLCTGSVMVGLLTRISTVPILIFLGVAAFIQHAHDPWMKRELPLLFAVPFLALLFTGAGRFSLDALIRPKWPFGGKSSS